jgi:hypothetical protein
VDGWNKGKPSHEQEHAQAVDWASAPGWKRCIAIPGGESCCPPMAREGTRIGRQQAQKNQKLGREFHKEKTNSLNHRADDRQQTQIDTDKKSEIRPAEIRRRLGREFR